MSRGYGKGSSSVTIQSSIMMYSSKVRKIRRAGEIFHGPNVFMMLLLAFKKFIAGTKVAVA